MTRNYKETVENREFFPAVTVLLASALLLGGCITV